jgi:ribosomal protein L7/L12
MNSWPWWILPSMLFLLWYWISLARSHGALEKRLLDLEIRFHKLQQHIGFVADATPPITDDVQILARTPGSKIAAIRAYRQQTGAGLKEAKDAVERMARS